MVLAMSSGALRKLSLKYEGKADHPLLASVPMSFDFSPDRISGNRFSGVLVALPVDVADILPSGCSQRHDAGRAGQGEPSTHRSGTDRALGRLHAAGPRRGGCSAGCPTRTARTRCSTSTSPTCPGRANSGKVGGATVTEIYSVGPITTGSGLNITVWSYVDQLNISVLSDDATVEDPHEVTDAHGRGVPRDPQGGRAFGETDGRGVRDAAVGEA